MIDPKVVYYAACGGRGSNRLFAFALAIQAEIHNKNHTKYDPVKIAMYQSEHTSCDAMHARIARLKENLEYIEPGLSKCVSIDIITADEWKKPYKRKKCPYSCIEFLTEDVADESM